MKIFSPEHRAKLAAALKGKTRSAETRARMSLAQTGREISDEHRNKIAAALRARRQQP